MGRDEGAKRGVRGGPAAPRQARTAPAAAKRAAATADSDAQGSGEELWKGSWRGHMSFDGGISFVD